MTTMKTIMMTIMKMLSKPTISLHYLIM